MTRTHTRLTVLALLLAIIACGGCSSAQQRQDLSDCRAGIEAASLAVDGLTTSGKIDALTAAKMHQMLSGADSYACAMLGDPDTLPAPRMRAAEIVETPGAYVEAAEKRREESRQGIMAWLAGALGAGGLLGVLIKLGRNVGGPLGAACAIADRVLPGRRAAKDMARKRRQMSNAAPPAGA